jgi:hypothetical protein
MSITFLVVALCGTAFLAIFALAAIYKPRAHDIDNVILLARKVDPADLETLFDAGAEWKLRQSLTLRAFREAQEGRIRLVREYLRRVVHNTNLIHLWVMREERLLAGKNPEGYNDRDKLIVQAFDLATEIRLYWFGAGLRIWLWVVLRAYRWPRVLIPRVSDLRVQCGVDVIEKYRRLIGLAAVLGAWYGTAYHDRLLEALQ